MTLSLTNFEAFILINKDLVITATSLCERDSSHDILDLIDLNNQRSFPEEYLPKDFSNENYFYAYFDKLDLLDTLCLKDMKDDFEFGIAKITLKENCDIFTVFGKELVINRSFVNITDFTLLSEINLENSYANYL